MALTGPEAVDDEAIAAPPSAASPVALYATIPPRTAAVEPLQQPREALSPTAGSLPSLGRADHAVVWRVGSKVLVRLDEPDENLCGGGGVTTAWVPGRVLARRMVGGGRRAQWKVGKDGYDSEEDEWLDADTDRVLPAAKPAAEAEAGKTPASKGQDADASQLDESRRLSSRRRLEARQVHSAASMMR